MAKEQTATPKSYKLPEGYEDEAEFIEEARERFQGGLDADRENRDEGQEDLRFFAGEQWDADARLRRNGRPMLTINQLPQFVAQVVGDIRINRPSIRVRPAEDADKDLAEIREGLIRQIERSSDAQGVYTNAGQNQVACGIGNFRVGLSYAADDGFDRDITLSAIPNAFSVVWDPYATERTGKDAQYCFVSDLVPRKEFERRFKDRSIADQGLEVPMTDVEGWFTGDSVRVTEYWLVKETKTKLALLEDGTVVDAKDVPQGAKVVRERETVRKSACMYLITGKNILAGPYELPIDRLPIIRVEGWTVNLGDKRKRWGLVRFARDAQRLKNYWRSVSAEMLALAPKGKWLLHESNDGDQDAFREAHNADDPILTWSGNTPPQYIGPPTLNAAVLQEAALAGQDLKDTTGLHDASLGAKSNETSGKAIMARQREGDVATYVYHDNLHAAIEAGGYVINQLIPVVYDTPRTIRILGEDSATKVQRVNDPANPDSVDLNKGRYDIAVETGPSYSTRRVEAAESMMAFVQAVPPAAAVSGDLIAQSMDWPMADKIAERLKKALPPQFADDDAEDMTPEQQQAKQQAAMMAQQQQKMQADAADAEVRKKQADADKAQAEAGKAQLELSQMTGQMQQMVQMHVEQILADIIGAPPPQFAPDGMAPPQDQGAMGQGFPSA